MLHRTSVAASSETQASPVIIKWSSQSTAHWLFYCYQCCGNWHHSFTKARSIQPRSNI